MNEPDWDAGTENAYEQRLHVSSDMCERCGNDVVVPNDPDDLCRACVLEVEGAIAHFEEAAYAPDDPKHPSYYERMSDIWDNREKVA